jgi:serine/threonine protein kinase
MLGEGGFAEIYLGEHIHRRSLTAIKILLNPAPNIQAFLVETQVMAGFQHPHILCILDFGLEQNLPFLVMDYARGGSLCDRYPEGSLASLPSVISYTKQVAEALSYVHAKRLIHRDVKPENILLSADGTLLSDFGLFTVAHGTLSMITIDKPGTADYMYKLQNSVSYFFTCFLS